MQVDPFFGICVHVSNLCACAFGVKCRLMYILLCVGTQIALLSSIVLIDSTSEKVPMVATIEAHTLSLLFVSLLATFKDVGPFNKLGCSLVDVIVDYCYVWKRMGTWMLCLNKKRAVVFWLCCWFSTISAMGLGILVVLLLVVVMRSNYYLKRAMNVKACHSFLYVVFGGGGDGDSCKRSTLGILTNTQTKHQNSSHSAITK